MNVVVVVEELYDIDDGFVAPKVVLLVDGGSIEVKSFFTPPVDDEEL